MKLDKQLDKISIEFTGFMDWVKFRDILILKMGECVTEEQFKSLLKALIGSTFMSANSINEARKTLKLPPLSEDDRKRIEKMANKK